MLQTVKWLLFLPLYMQVQELLHRPCWNKNGTGDRRCKTHYGIASVKGVLVNDVIAEQTGLKKGDVLLKITPAK